MEIKYKADKAKLFVNGKEIIGIFADDDVIVSIDDATSGLCSHSTVIDHGDHGVCVSCKEVVGRGLAVFFPLEGQGYE